MEFDAHTLEIFIKNQTQLFPKVLVEDNESAAELLEELGACVCANVKEVKEYLEDSMDVSYLSDSEILEIEEVFDLKDGRFLVVEG